MVFSQDAEILVFAQAAQKGPDARRCAGYPSAGWVQVRGVLCPYVAAPRKRAGYPPEVGHRRWAFFSSLLALESCFLLRGAFLLLVLLSFCFLVPSLCHLFLTLVLILLAAFVSQCVPPLLLSVIFSP